MRGRPTESGAVLFEKALHTPVYASFKGPQTGMVVDLSELLDVHEDGFAIEISEKSEIVYSLLSRQKCDRAHNCL